MRPMAKTLRRIWINSWSWHFIKATRVKHKRVWSAAVKCPANYVKMILLFTILALMGADGAKGGFRCKDNVKA